MPAAVPSMSIAPLIVTSTTGTTIQALDYLTGETSGMATVMSTHSDRKTTEKKEKKTRRHWWSRIRRGRPCREMKTLETAQPSRSPSRGRGRSPRPLDDDMFPRTIRSGSSQSLPTLHTPPAIKITPSPGSGVSSSSVDSSPRASSCSTNSFSSGTSRATTTSGAAGVYEALGTKAIITEQKKLQNYRARQGILGDRSVDAIVLGGAFVFM
ncbi:uncharacterized protein Z520_03287 [Fonsecaea multimorphosa CBS 102226]|uniref:Uncharacterized protein n=1 Tax=Fonsecaea multimorphosa CBS 102226 TaxID=1442371 RepID=A0A0D2KV50_9EURO|nr:uncharacterized protein Z520_03287 [Fonsecaea multimorphosa CBS 102226]KIY00624.1 hypothetical protein Z520_03287 [Fonsecaea multimorphosa CBS 102226]OAL19014.1 hypothetical protein AYO22_10343 [Fonsecaea multimorphosa]